MTDFHRLVEEARRNTEKKREEAKCRAIGCAKQRDGQLPFCLRHWSALSREQQGGIMNLTENVREQLIEEARDQIHEFELRGRG